MTNYLRRAEEDDHAKILQLWRVNVTATHQFLTQNDIEYLYQMLKKQWLNNVELWLLYDGNQLLGFIGLDNNKVEMLFVDNDYQGCGHGKRLLNFAKQKYDKIYLDVNEQNPQALAFYQKQGFHIIGRSPFDSLGNPFPLLHLIYENISVNTQ